MTRLVYVPIPAKIEYQIIPCQPGVPNYDMTVTLDGTAYKFRLLWNNTAVDEGWYLDVSTDDDEPILVGMRIVLGVAIGRTSTHALFQSGALMAYDLSGKHLDPGFDDLGLRVELRWHTTAQLLAAVGLKRTLVP